ncbi:MAG: hypothetical protein KH020_08535 [Clostridiales bacterium]|nr:hypothetical protein [Clostridiales bacterium]
MSRREKKPLAIGVWKVSIIALFCAITASIFAYYQINTYEKSIIEIYATQQDNFVEAIFDQMNHSNEEQDEETITKFIENLGASSNRYWTVSKEGSFVFLKNEIETNKYKGLTNTTYYGTDSAKEFLRNLQVNKVNHRLVQLDKRAFVASGVVLEQGGIQYQLCFLSRLDSVLENNTYLHAKINLSAMIVVILMIFVLFLILLTSYNVKKQKEMKEIERECSQLRKTIQRINEESQQYQLYDTRQNLFLPEVLPLLLEKLEKRNVRPITFVTVKADNKEVLQTFLQDSQLILDQSILRFSKGELKILLIFLQYKKEKAMNLINSLKREDLHFIEWIELEKDSNKTITQVLQKKGEEDNGK